MKKYILYLGLGVLCSVQQVSKASTVPDIIKASINPSAVPGISTAATIAAPATSKIVDTATDTMTIKMAMEAVNKLLKIADPFLNFPYSLPLLTLLALGTAVWNSERFCRSVGQLAHATKETARETLHLGEKCLAAGVSWAGVLLAANGFYNFEMSNPLTYLRPSGGLILALIVGRYFRSLVNIDKQRPLRPRF